VNKDSIAYLQAIGIDVWLRKDQIKTEALREETHEAEKQPSYDFQPVRPPKPSRTQQRKVQPEVAQKPVTPQGEPQNIDLWFLSFGKMAVLGHDIQPSLYRSLQDISFFLNNYSQPKQQNDRWVWPTIGTQNTHPITSHEIKGFHVWLKTRMRGKVLLFLLKDKMTEIMMDEFNPDITVINLDGKPFTKEQKVDLWAKLCKIQT